MDKEYFLEDGVLWFCKLGWFDYYKSLNINNRINYKQSYFDFTQF